MRHIFITIIFSLLGWVNLSAQSTDVLIVEGNTLTEQETDTLYPIFCSNVDCGRIVDLLFPSLLNIDWSTATIIPADQRTGLVESWDINENFVTYTLRDDQFWSDGHPITAYDVFFSYLIGKQQTPYSTLFEQYIEAVAPLDTQTIQFQFLDTNCEVLVRSNFPIMPSHQFDAEFASTVDYDEADDLVEWSENFPLPDVRLVINSPEYANPTITSGNYHLAERRLGESIHLLADDNSVAYSYVDVNNADDIVDQYLRGDLNLLIDPPYNRRSDLWADINTMIYSYPGNYSYFVGLNLADPSEPESAFDEEGNPLDQGIHPILEDKVVRQAMQMALDVPAIIDAVVEGDGVQLGGSLPPAGLGYDPELEPIVRDVMAARQLLFDAGWRDMDGDGWRECLNCELAERGQQLTIRLYYVESFTPEPTIDNLAIVTLIQKQMEDVGIEVIVSSQSNFGPMFRQQFDAVLLSGIPVDSVFYTIWEFFRQSEDKINEGLNFTSYANEEINRLLDEADHAPDCDPEIRRELYQQADAILQEDDAFLWLFSPNPIIATRHSGDLPQEILEDFVP